MRARVFGRLVLTLIAAGGLLAALGLVERASGNGRVLWITNQPTAGGRVSGPFVIPNHFAAWLEVTIPVTLAYAVVLMRRLGRRLLAVAEVGRGTGVRARRAWVGAVIQQQTHIRVAGCPRVKGFKRKSKLALALAKCRKQFKHNAHRRARCEHQARKKYGSKKARAHKRH